MSSSANLAAELSTALAPAPAPAPASSSSSSAAPPQVPVRGASSPSFLNSFVAHPTVTTPTPAPSSSNVESADHAKNSDKVDHLVKSMQLQQQVVGIMRRILPSVVSIEPSAVELITDCMLEFASSMSYEAIVTAAQDGRNVVQGSDFEAAVRGLGFEDFAEPIAEFDLKRQRHVNNTKCTLCSGRIDFSKKLANTKKKYAKKSETAPVPTASTATAAPVTGSSSSSASSTLPSTSTPTPVGIAQTVAVAEPVKGAVPAQQDQPEVTKEKRKNKPRTNWLDPVFVEEFTRRMNEALSKEKDDPIVMLRQISKEMHISMQILKQKFDEAKRMKMQSSGETS